MSIGDSRRAPDRALLYRAKRMTTNAPGGDEIEPGPKFEELMIPLREPIHGLTELSAVLGVPEWWPTGNRVAVCIAHGGNSNFEDPLVEYLHHELTARRFMTLRFNFPFAEAGKRSSADTSEMLDIAFRSAIATLGRDPTAAPAHLFIGGVGLGAKVACGMAAAPLRLDGLFFLNYPLHPQDKPEEATTDELYRITSPMLFVQGLRDRHCDVPTLRRVLGRVGAPTRLHLVEEADASFKTTKRSGIDARAVHHAVLESLASWIDARLDSA